MENGLRLHDVPFRKVGELRQHGHDVLELSFGTKQNAQQALDAHVKAVPPVHIVLARAAVESVQMPGERPVGLECLAVELVELPDGLVKFGLDPGQQARYFAQRILPVAVVEGSALDLLLAGEDCSEDTVVLLKFAESGDTAVEVGWRPAA